MITRLDLDERVREWQLHEAVVEKDYVIGWLLWGFGSDPTLSRYWAFKGGTCLKKCFIETFRFSEDLDFSVLPGGPFRPEAVAPLLENVLRRVHDASGIDFSREQLRYRVRPGNDSAEGRIYYLGPRGAPTVAMIKLDVAAAEEVVRPTVLRDIGHSYPDDLPAPAKVRCYAFEEVFAEKLRALGERTRPRDLYDVILLFRRPDLRQQPDLIQRTLVEKSSTKGVPVPSLEALTIDTVRAEVEAEWDNMLGHQLPQEPPFHHTWGELPALFDWLEGSATPEELEPIRQHAGRRCRLVPACAGRHLGRRRCTRGRPLCGREPFVGRAGLPGQDPAHRALFAPAYARRSSSAVRGQAAEPATSIVSGRSHPERPSHPDAVPPACSHRVFRARTASSAVDPENSIERQREVYSELRCRMPHLRTPIAS